MQQCRLGDVTDIRHAIESPGCRGFVKLHIVESMLSRGAHGCGFSIDRAQSNSANLVQSVPMSIDSSTAPAPGAQV
jgi:hypothetical protein